MPQEYTPSGSSQAYTVPAYSDTVDGPTAFKSFADDVASAVAGLVTALAGKANLAGATFTGEVDVVSATAAGSTSVRQITISTSNPSGGADGDVWLVYV